MNRRVRLGYWDKACNRRLYYPGEAHLILTAPAGAGKGRDLLIPALLEYEGSAIVIDPKAQLCSVTAHHRAKGLGQRTVALNPFNILPDALAGIESIGFNPMGILDPRLPSFGADCDALAEGVVNSDAHGDSHWTDSGRQLVSGVIMTLAKIAPRHMRNLISVYEIISGPNFFDFARQAVKTGDLLICGRLGRFAAAKASENRELLGIVSTAITHFGIRRQPSTSFFRRATLPHARSGSVSRLPPLWPICFRRAAVTTASSPCSMSSRNSAL